MGFLNNIIDGTSNVIGMLADFGVSSLISNASTTMVTKSNNKLLDKVMIGIGSAALAGLAGEAANKYVVKKGEDIKKALEALDGICSYDDEDDEEGDE